MLFRLKRMLTLMLALILAAPVLPAFVLAESTIEIDDSARLDTDDALDLDLAMDESDDLFADGLEDLGALDNLSPDLSLNVEEAEEETAPALSTQVNSINASMLLGVWTGTYTGRTSNGSNIERVIRLDIDYSEDNSIEGMATIDVGENGSYFFSGTFDPESGNISFKGTDWIDNPSNFSFSSFSGVVNEEGNSIQGIIDDSSSRVFSLNKTSDSYDSRRIDVQAVPRDWKGKYDGTSGSITVRRNYEMHIESLSSDGIIKGKAFISPSEEADPQYDATGSYYFSGSIDGRRGKIKLQGSDWIDYPEEYSDFGFVAFEGFLDSSLSSITGKTQHGIWEMKATSTSPEASKPSGVTITQGKSASMKVGDTLTLKAKLTPKGAKTTLTWSSSKPTVATVTKKGKVKALKAGSTKITVKTANGKKATCKITVTNVKPTSISINPKKVTMRRNETLNLAVTFKPKNTTNKAVTWKSNRPLVAKVNSKGVVTALRPGKATITAVSKADKSLKATCTVTVAGKFRALMIGQNKYKKNPLKGCVNDANAMKGMLDGLADDYATCKVQKNRTANEIVSDIQTYLGSATENDVSVFFYSGHGANDDGGTNQGALCGIDGSFLSTAKLASALGKVKGRVIVLIDACHSGALISKNGGGSASAPFDPDTFVQGLMSVFADRGDVSNAAEFRNSKYVVLVAAGFDETSSEEPTGMLWWKSHQGRFTAALIKGMGCNYKKGTYKGSMPADRNSDKGVTVEELFNYINNEVGEEQTTGFYADNTGEIMFMH